ncbi:MAG TPA: TIGR02281 family clan AA aspartic protease [Burkholderiales bacterium]|nr:TIGR02281 family clan AA aspartic protease [Burkholderiales bacterium]
MRYLRGSAHMIAVGWLLLLGAMFWFFSDLNERETNPNRNIVAAASAEMVLQRSRNGHYYADGEINGQPVKFLLDTGATQIALSPKLASALGLSLGRPVTLQTAAGLATGYPARLARVRLGSIEMQNLGAVVSEGMSDESVLLGMNFLKHLEITQRGDQLTLRPPGDAAQLR